MSAELPVLASEPIPGLDVPAPKRKFVLVHDDEDSSSGCVDSDAETEHEPHTSPVKKPRRRVAYFYGATKPVCYKCKDLLYVYKMDTRRRLHSDQSRRRIWNMITVAGVQVPLVGAKNQQACNTARNAAMGVLTGQEECAACGPSSPEWSTVNIPPLMRAMGFWEEYSS